MDLCTATRRRPTEQRAPWTFKLSGAYLGVLLLAILRDRAT